MKLKTEFLDITEKDKIILLNALGYQVNSDGFIINNENGQKHICPITKEPVLLKNASILPGSTIIINTSPITLSEYFSRYYEEPVDND